MTEEEFKKYVNRMNENIGNILKDHDEELMFYVNLVKRFNDICEEKEKQKEVIDEITSAIQGDIDGFATINNYGECNEILEILEIYLDILKEVSE